MQNLSGQTIKGYELMERIGAGAFGAVYRSYQSTVGREVALKVILPGFASHPNFIRRFEMEAQIVARLEHLHIVPLYDYWRDPSGAYLAMRWLRGGDLSETIRERPLSLEETTRVFDQIGAALSAAHRSNIIHRDLKPSNILLDQDGNTYLADFGIATEMGMPAGSAVDGENIVGSPAYLSPEQARRELVTPRSDIYSLGVILYETLSGEHPFPKTSPVELIYAHLNEPLPKVNNLPPDLQEGVNEVIQKATAKNPQNRYQDVLDMVNALRQTSKLESEETGEKIVESLTAREQEILSLIVEGHTNKRIAQELYVEVSTIKWYITQIYRKLNVRSRAQAIMRSRELQLIFTAEGSPEGETDSKMVSLDSELLRNPYKGLRNFEGADSRDFYGREAMIDKLVDRLDENGRFSRFLAIVGPSGSGKSSLLKAGLIPALRQGAITGSERWFVVEMAPGNRPLDELEIALSRVAAEQAGNIRVQLERGVNGLARVAGLILPNDGSDLLIAIDQFEEVFTLVEEEATRVHFLNLIHAAVNAPHSRVRVVINLRADFYDRPLHYPKFGEMVRKRLETVLPLSAEELERAILHPARGVGVDFQPGLVASIIDEINYQPGALPLLQYALTELFESRKDHTLTHQAYHDIGGTVGALANRAEEIYRELDGEGKNLTQQLFLRLVSLEDSSKERKRTSNIRQRIFRSDLLSIVSDEELMDEIIDTFAAYRLLSLDHDTATRSPTVELAHEALIQQWDRLQIWIEDSRDDLRQHQRLRTLMREWIESDREKGFLLRETRLDAFETWSASTDISLTPDERDFIEASLSARRARRDEEENRQQRELETARKLAETERRRAEEQTQAAQRLQRRAVFLSAALMVALISAVAALAFARNATVQHRNAFARELAGAALNTLEQDPDLSTLLVLEAAEQTRQINGTVLPEVEEALHLVLQGFRLLLTLPHGGSAAFSPDGSRLATGGGDGTIKIWDTETGQVMFAFKGHDEPVPGLAFSPDGNRLASISLDGYMRIWDTKGVQMLGVRGDLGDLMDMDFSPDGKRIAAGGWIGARVWNAENGEALAYYSTLNSPIGGIKFSPDGNTLATSHQNGITILWDAETDKELSSLPRRRDPHLSGIDISPSGRYVAASSNEGVTIWDYEGNVIETLFHPAPVVDIAYHPKGTLLATSSEDGTIRLWEVTTSQQLLQLGGHKDRIRNIKFHPDGKRLVSTSVDGVTRIWDISPEGSREWFAIDIGDFAFNASFDSTGTRLAVSSRRAASIVIDLTTGHTIFEQGITSSNFYQIALSPDRKHLALVNLDGTLSIWDLQSGVELFRLTEHRRSVSGMAFSSDGMRLATADTSGTVILWDAEKWEKLLTLEGHTDWVPAVAFSPDGERLATASLDTRAMVWDVNTGEKLFDLDDHTSEVWDVAFSPDGGLLATASWDSTVKIWNAESGELVKSLESHTANVNGVAFSPDGKTLASAGYDQTVKLWDVTTWDESLNLSGNQAPVTSVNFSPDGKKLVTGNADGMVRVYALDIDDLIMLARNRVTRPLTEEECQRHLHTESCPPAP